MATYIYNNATSSPSSDEKVRIYSYWQSNIILDELSIPLTDISDASVNATDVFGIEVPLIRINNKILTNKEIASLYIDCSGFIPRIELKAVFNHERFLLLNQIKDGDLVSIAIRSQTDSLKIIRNDYIITNAYVSEKETSATYEGDTTLPYMVTFIGELFIPNIDSSDIDSSFLGTSYECMQNVAKLLNLGFASNEISTDDRQIWLSCNATPRVFIQNVIENSWKDTNSFFDVWIDVFYNLNFININSQLLSSEESLDYGALMKNYDSNYIYGAQTKKKDTILFPKFLTNIKVVGGTSAFISSWHTENNSSYITSLIGTTLNCNLYEHNNNVYDNKGTIYWSLPIEPIYDENKLQSHIILRGRCTYNEQINTGELAQIGRAHV